jgi:hypothetical protein
MKLPAFLKKKQVLALIAVSITIILVTFMFFIPLKTFDASKILGMGLCNDVGISETDASSSQYTTYHILLGQYHQYNADIKALNNQPDYCDTTTHQLYL